jgi:hypothetical protein
MPQLLLLLLLLLLLHITNSSFLSTSTNSPGRCCYCRRWFLLHDVLLQLL